MRNCAMKMCRMKMGDNVPTNRLGGGMISDEMIISVSADKITGGSGGGGTTTNALTIHTSGGDVVFNGAEAKEATIPSKVSELTNDSGFQTAANVTSALEPYAKTEALSAYATTESLAGYATTESLANYATTESLASYVQTSVADTTYVKVSDLNTKVNELITTALANYYTKTEANEKFQAKS